jgi:Zn-dependent protease with chaperone function
VSARQRGGFFSLSIKRKWDELCIEPCEIGCVDSSLYPPNVTGVPPDLTVAHPKYRRQVMVVFLCLVLFLLLYLALVAGSAWLFWTALVAPLAGEGRGPVFLKIGSIAITGFLFIFLVKGLFKRQGSDDSLKVEIFEKDQPELFAFIRRVCSDTKAPSPYRVFLTPEVNAAVFYETSILNLIFPVRKNLMIGLGLVNMLTLAEFKAVLAHEFGHFAQSSMRLGSYVYVANRIIFDMVYGRDFWDTALSNWKNVGDFRISLPGHLLYGIVWVLRKILELAFRLINFAEASLSREMEFHADLVAVSLTGSDVLIHGLRRLGLADASLSHSLQDLKSASHHHLYTRDLYFHQTRGVDHVRRVEKKPDFGEPPALPENPSERSQVFTKEEEGISSMWASHPSNYDREENAKRRYFRSPLDDRSPWLLFRNTAQVKEQLTRELYKRLDDSLATASLTEPETVQEFIDAERAETTFDPRYFGLYDSRFIQPGELRATVEAVRQSPWSKERLAAFCSSRHNQELEKWAEAHHQRQGEQALLEGLQSGALGIRGKTFDFRGQERRRDEVEDLLKSVEGELESDQKYLAQVDEAVFVAHYQMAGQLGDGSHEELWWRYQFHLEAQEIAKVANAEMARCEYLLNYANSQERLGDEFEEFVRMFRDSRQTFENALAKAHSLKLPALRNMEAGTPLISYVRPGPPVPPLIADDKGLSGEWLMNYMRQLSEVQERSRRVHFKSLGALLALQERITARWLQKQAE